LKTLSANVVSVCQLSEKCFRNLLRTNCNKPPSSEQVKSALIIQILSLLVNSNVFDCLHDHILHGDPMADHRVRLMKQVCLQYLSVRFYNAGRVFTQQLQGDRVRSVLNKTIIFKGQKQTFRFTASSQFFGIVYFSWFNTMKKAFSRLRIFCCGLSMFN
jgi:hypothetical protein